MPLMFLCLRATYQQSFQYFMYFISLQLWLWVKYHTKIKLGTRHCANLVLDTEQLLQNFRKSVGNELCLVKVICKRVDERGSATERKPARYSDRPKTARTEENVRSLSLFTGRLFRTFTTQQAQIHHSIAR